MVDYQTSTKNESKISCHEVGVKLEVVLRIPPRKRSREVRSLGFGYDTMPLVVHSETFLTRAPPGC
jgi:hypothetical protein